MQRGYSLRTAAAAGWPTSCPALPCLALPAASGCACAHLAAAPALPPLGCSYECPLESLSTFYRPPARLMLSIDNMHSNGVQLTQVGRGPPPHGHPHGKPSVQSRCICRCPCPCSAAGGNATRSCGEPCLGLPRVRLGAQAIFLCATTGGLCTQQDIACRATALPGRAPLDARPAVWPRLDCAAGGPGVQLCPSVRGAAAGGDARGWPGGPVSRGTAHCASALKLPPSLPASLSPQLLGCLASHLPCLHTSPALAAPCCHLVAQEFIVGWKPWRLPCRPRELPIVEGQSLAELEIRRLGVKTYW